MVYVPNQFSCLENCGNKVCQDGRRCCSCAMKKMFEDPIYKQKMFLVHKGSKRSDKCKKKMSIKAKERLKNPKNNSNYKDGRTLVNYLCKNCDNPIDWRCAIYGSHMCKSCSCKHRLKDPKNHPGYLGDDFNRNYPLEFNNSLKEEIRKRDNYTCQNCDMTEEESLIVYGEVLHVHHIDYNKQNCEEWNLISSCRSCNVRFNYNRDYWQNLLTKKIVLIGED